MEQLNASLFKQMLVSGANNLTNHQAEIDALNVFPVPDGDTGTNMSMTFNNGVKEVVNADTTDLASVCKVLSKGLLMGARGNSGVILSQIFRGFYQGLQDKSEANVADLAGAFIKGTEVAYKAVMRPVEGTILTVVRESSEMAQHYVNQHPECSLKEYFEVLCHEAKDSLDNTPNLLPVLKEVNTVDSGGTGLLMVLEGFKAALLGNPVQAQTVQEAQANSAAMTLENEGFGYCTEFILRLSEKAMKTFQEEKLRKSLEQLGESIVVVQDEDIVKVHVHTLTPGEVLNLGQRYGEFAKLKIENMQEQHNNIISDQEAKAPKKDYAIIAVAAGQGLSDLFKEYRVDVVISGGQTMNPSTEDFVAAIKKLNAEHILILPNNSNIVLAAQQAATVFEDLDVQVLPTKSIPQGLSACIMFNPEDTVENNLANMMEAVEHVKTGQITYAVKDTTFSGQEIKAGDYMGIFEKNIVVSTPDMMNATKVLVDSMIDSDAEIVTLLVGEDATQQQSAEIVSYIEEKYDLEVDVQQGGQPVYSFILGVE